MEAFSSQKLTTFNLNGSNYLLWSRAAKNGLCGRGKWGYVNGSAKQPNEDDVSFEKWFQEDKLVLTWLQGSIEPSIYFAYSFAETSKELWDNLQRVYGNVSNICC